MSCRLSQILLFACASISTLCADEQREVDLKNYEKKLYSEHGEYGVLEKIFEIIGPRSKFFVEFGVQDGTECNKRYLKER